MKLWILKKLHLFPIVFGAGLFIGLIICYFIAFAKNHVSIYVPFISETGAHLPESGIFGLFLVTGAILGMFTIAIRFLVVAENNDRHVKRIFRVNSVSLYLGIISFCGLLIVAVYPVSGYVYVHTAGSFTAFSGLIVYAFLQSLLTHWMYPSFNEILVFKVRLALSIMCLLFSLTTTFIEVYQSVLGIDHSSEAHKMPGEQGFTGRLTGAICQRLLVTSLIIFMLTYVREFQKVCLQISIKHANYNFNAINIGELNIEERPLLM